MRWRPQFSLRLFLLLAAMVPAIYALGLAFQIAFPESLRFSSPRFERYVWLLTGGRYGALVNWFGLHRPLRWVLFQMSSDFDGSSIIAKGILGLLNRLFWYCVFVFAATYASKSVTMRIIFVWFGYLFLYFLALAIFARFPIAEPLLILLLLPLGQFSFPGNITFATLLFSANGLLWAWMVVFGLRYWGWDQKIWQAWQRRTNRPLLQGTERGTL